MTAPRLSVAASLLLATLSLLAAPAPAAAQDRMAPGAPHETEVVVGEMPPTDFALESIDGVVHGLAEARGERPLLLLFFRGTW